MARPPYGARYGDLADVRAMLLGDEPDRETDAERLLSDDLTPELPYFDEDWFRFYHHPADRDDIRYYEVHELTCTVTRCAYRDEPCPWHPIGCRCSDGECQRG